MSLALQIEQQIRNHFDCEVLSLENESHRHAGPATESHFKLVMVSSAFAGVSKVKRQQAVYKALAALMPQFHALGLHTYTPEEWAASNQQAPASPKCGGGH